MRLILITLVTLIIATIVGLGATWMTATRGVNVGTMEKHAAQTDHFCHSGLPFQISCRDIRRISRNDPAQHSAATLAAEAVKSKVGDEANEDRRPAHPG